MQEHDERLRMVLDRLKKANVTVNVSRSAFRKTEIDFCVHRLSARGVTPTAATVKAATDAPRPTNVKELRSFLGMTGWSSRFIPAYADVVRPQAVMLRKEVPFEWTEEAESSFRRIKKLVSSSPVLKPFTQGLPSTDCGDVRRVRARSGRRPVAGACRRLGAPSVLLVQVLHRDRATLLCVGTGDTQRGSSSGALENLPLETTLHTAYRPLRADDTPLAQVLRTRRSADRKVADSPPPVRLPRGVHSGRTCRTRATSSCSWHDTAPLRTARQANHSSSCCTAAS